MPTKQFDVKEFDANKNYIIEASAGTGKTYNVIEIVKKLVIEHNVSLNRILIVTYTEKAVGELRNRIRKELGNINVDAAPIYTIHSFCKDALNEFGLSANMPLGMNVIDENEIKDFAERYVREGEILERITQLMALEMEINVNTIKDFLIKASKQYYLNRKYEEDHSIITLLRDPDEDKIYDRLILIKTVETFEEFIAKDPETNFYYGILSKSKNKTCQDFVVAIKAEECWKNLFSFDGQKFKITIMVKNLSEKKEFPNPFHGSGYSFDSENDDDSMVSELDAFNYFKNLKENLRKFKANITLSRQFLVDFYKKWQKEKEYAKSEDFDDMLRYAREAIKNEPDFAKALRNKFTYGIIDEFQDTNQKQFDIFSEIFLHDKNHHLIVVGDPKQSIYSFQGADVEVYRNAVKEIQNKGGELTVLNKNYRSSAKMIQACNILFHPYFKNPDEFQDCDFLEDREHDVECEKKEHIMHYKKTGYEETDAPIWILDATDVSSANIPDDRNNSEDGKKRQKKESKEDIYARMVAKIIIECCLENPDKTTRLRIKDKDAAKFRNVSFKDFTILARSRTEMIPYESALKRAGIPFLRYKDQSLFSGKECAYWIALLMAINSPDFVGYRRNLLKKALFTPFFKRSLEEIHSNHFNKDDIPEIELINKWRVFSSLSQWEDLFDSIIIDTDINRRLQSPSDMTTLSIIKQISNYCINFLSKGHALSDLIKNLKSLSTGHDDELEEGGNIIEKATDFDCVKIMTMHASKGLQFPVVFNVGVSKQNFKENQDGPIVYHIQNKNDEKSIKVLDFYKSPIKMEENMEERKRLFYVANTRAQFLTIMPIFEEADDYIKESIEALKTNDKGLLKIIRPKDDDFDFSDALIYAKSILRKGVTTNKDDATPENQLMTFKDIIKSDGKRKSYKHSYSSLTHPSDEKNNYADDDYLDKEGKKDDDLASFDKEAIQLYGNYNESVPPIEIDKSYPKGTYIGTALHEVFEKLDFEKYNANLDVLIKRCFRNQGIATTNKNWIESSEKIVENVMNGIFPEIHGNNKTAKFFKLSELAKDDHKPEMEFNFNLFDKFKNYCNGFIDLLFKRGEYYSILDWKSDSLNEDFNSYSSSKELKKHTDDSYSIQRVLYSYCLIMALKQNYPDLDEEEIFSSHFGGIYYVYIKGCNTDTSNGIYSQTWDSFASLKKAFDNIVSAKVGKKHE